MADIKVKIKLNAGVDGDQINLVGFDRETNNVSRRAGDKTTQNNGQNLISWGENGLVAIDNGFVGGIASTLGKQGGYNGFVFGVVPKNKQYSVEITLEGSNIDSVTFYGDKTANQFPTRAIINGEYIYSDDPEWSIVFPTTRNSQTITFDMWNRANYNACLTHIGVLTNEVVLDKHQISSIESVSQSSGRPKDIFYGVISSSGSFEVLDVSGELRDLAQDKIISSGNEVQVIANNNVIQNHTSLSPKYNKTDVLQCEISNRLSKLDTLSFSGFDLDVEGFSLITVLYDILLQAGIRLKTDMFESEQIKDRVTNIFIPYSYMKPSTLREALDKICQVAQLNIYMDDYNNLRISDARPISYSKKIISIPLRNQISTKEENVLRENKYDKVEVPYNDVFYEYVEIARKTFFVYEPPFFSRLKDTSRNKEYYMVENNLFDELVDIHKSNTNIEYLGFNVPYTDDIYMGCSLIKFSVWKDNSITEYKDFKLEITGDSIIKLMVVVGSNATVDYMIRETDSGEVTDVLHFTSEREVLNNFFTFKANGDIEFCKYYAHKLAVVVKEDVIDFYILKPDVIIEDDNVRFASLPYYNGSFVIYNKELRETANTYNLGSGDNVISLQGNNELINGKANYNSFASEFSGDVQSVLAQTILKDYKDGIFTIKMSVSCLDMFDINGNKVKDFSKGEVLQVGDVVRIDSDNYGKSKYTRPDGSDMYFRVTGRTFRYSGVPMIDLELQEVRVVE